MEKYIRDDILIRKILYGDASGIAKNGNNKKIYVNQRESFPHPYTLDCARRWIKFAKQYHDKTRFIIATPNEAIGEIGFLPGVDVHRNSAELSFWIAEPYWGKGIMTDALTFIIDYAFSEFNMHRLFADVMAYNKPSQRVLQKKSFQLDGVLRSHVFKDGEYFDMIVYSLLATEKDNK